MHGARMRLGALTASLSVLLALTACDRSPPTQAPKADATADAKAKADADPKVQEAVEIATDAYVYGYSLITTEVTRVQMSNVAKLESCAGPMNRFVNVKRYPPADYRGVSAPNADTLYSVAWLDLAEPQVFSHPDMGKRFYLFEMVDLWMTIFDSPGTRTAAERPRTTCSPARAGRARCPRG